jgi:hypothetical protein
MSTLKAVTLMAIGSILTAGCTPVSTTPDTDARLGEAVNIIKAQQIINPDASRNTNPVAGIDGKAARAAMDQYRKSFGEAKQAEGKSPAISVSQGDEK